MRIGILSMQKVINYGSFLQSFALKKIIESIGHEVHFIDIIPGERTEYEVKDSTAQKPKIDKTIFKRIEHVFYAKIRRYQFVHKIWPSIGIDRPATADFCDRIVIGSDEVFNCLQPSIGFSEQLLGNIEPKAITYAASCGYTSVEAIRALGLDKRAGDSLRKLDAISVRDQNTFNFVFHLTGGGKPYIHLDPVFIYNWDSLVKINKKYSDYILVYAYDNRINDQEEITAIQQFAKKYKKKLLSFGVYQRWCDKNVICDPLELISYFDGADYVITDTFHGTVLSIKRNKLFGTFVRNTNDNKLNDLLGKFDLLSRRIENLQDLEAIITQEIDYSAVNRTISNETEKAIDYLKQNL